MQKEVNKFLKKINVEKLRNNHKECIELYNIIGGLYSEVGSYDEAIHYHEQALEICKKIGDRLATASAFRYIGEAKAALGNFYQAIDYTKKYLDLAQRTNDKVEVQRAWTTLGRVYLMQAQELRDKSNVVDEKVREIAREAEKRFQTALNLAESIRDQVDDKEFAQMKSGLLINLGLVNDICDKHVESVQRINKAIELCKVAKLKEDLHRCQTILTGIYRQRNNIKMAVRSSEEALVTAKQIGKKILICDAYIERGLVKILQRDFKNAKRAFAQAYLEKSPSEDDHAKAIRLTKIAHLIATNHEKLSEDSGASESRLRTCDKLGDLFVSIDAFKLAVEFYKRAFADAKVCAKPKSELARILYSIAETYADDRQFEHALVCYEKEFAYRAGNDKEQCQSLIKIAHMQEYLEREPSKVSEAYEKALDKAGKDPKLMYGVLKDYVPYLQKKSFNLRRSKELENILLNLKSYPEVMEEIEGEDCEESNDVEDEVANIDDIITDDEGNDEVMMIGRKRSRGPSKFKANEVGDTPLHEACIKGDIKRVKSLIGQGHEVNPRDHAGWIPLHEASNHGHYDIVEYLLENGADVNNRGLKGMSPLHDAATNGHYDIMRLLMRNSANVIALTDTGETVLSCLRDYKKRNYSDMSNSDLSEYKHMEAELLNAMDKCGFNLMKENIKNLGSNNKASSSGSALEEEVRPKARNIMASIEREPLPNPVKDYKNVIGTLKRKRLIGDGDIKEQPKKTNLPATYGTGDNTSASTKEWLIDDVSKEKRIIRKRSAVLEVLESDEDEDEDHVVTSPRNRQDKATDELRKVSEPEKLRQAYNRNTRRILIDSDDDMDFFSELPPARTKDNCDSNSEDDSEIQLIEPEESTDKRLGAQLSRSPELLTDSAPARNTTTPSFDGFSASFDHQSNQSSIAKPSVSRFDIFEQPLMVTIDGRKLLIPIKDKFATIKWLKESIVERYSILVNAKPNISLALGSDRSCVLLVNDQDFCCDVLSSCELIAIIDSWQLKSIESSYIENCAKFQLEPMNFIKLELRSFEENGGKLELADSRFPGSHIKAITLALAHRKFMDANLSGAASFFSGRFVGQETLESVLTWKMLHQLNLKCVGLTRGHFELLCSRMMMGELKFMDLSFNIILFKSKDEFRSNIEKLLAGCPKLKRLDMRRNLLQFSRQELPIAPSGPGHEMGMGENEKSQSENRVKSVIEMIDLRGIPSDFQIMGSGEQNEHSVYLVGV